ncbi:MAG TPA: CehA/McbA family metallohydrolase [Thermoleophilaceae bacterium]
MAQDLLRRGEGRFWRGNLHCHSDRSDGLLGPRQVVSAYREAGYDFIALSDHFEERYGWRITDTRDLRTSDFTTILGAELSSGPWRDRTAYWVSAVGLPLDFDPPPAGDPAEVIGRADVAGAFIVLLHPGLNNLPLDAVARLPAFDAVDAVEIYNHNTFGSSPDRASGEYMVDGLLERGRPILINAGDDAHFAFPGDRFGGWIEVWAETLDPPALLAALRSGAYYSTQGPRIERLEVDGERLHVSTSPVHAIALGGAGDRWLDATSVLDENGGLVSEGTFELSAFRESYCRVTVLDADRRRAWSNPIWP